MKALSRIFLFCTLFVFGTAAWADNYDTMRAQWLAIQVGASNNMSDADVAAAVNTAATTANTDWSSMATGSGRTYLWSDLTDFTNSATISTSYSRLQAMAVAYAQPGNSLQGNASLGAAVIDGLDWMYANHYNEHITNFGNFYDWQIGSAQASMSASLMVYGLLNATQIANYTAAIDHFDPDNHMYAPSHDDVGVLTGANLTDVCLAQILRGILGKTSTNITTAESYLSPVFLYVTTGDGFYTDGSFVQHAHIAYTASYGSVLLGDIANLFLLLNNSAWPITDPNAGNVWNWAVQSYVPVIMNGAASDIVSGRGIGNCAAWDHAGGRGLVTKLLRLSYGLSPTQAAYLQGLVKTWSTTDTSFNGYTNVCNGITYSSYYTGLGTFDLANLKSVQANSAIAAVTPPTGDYNFYNMQRVVHALPGYTLALSIFSNKISAFECGGGGNLRGWYSGAGMTYLYNADLTQYDNNYWGTINMTRLPGVTTDSSTKTPTCNYEAYLNTYSWVGSSSVDNLYASTGMQFTLAPVTNSTLNGQKSWFWFGNKMVALGAGINSTSAGAVETIVDNRKIDSAGDNSLVVNGAAQSTSLGWSSTLAGVSWAWLDGNVANSGVGYYFPGTASLYALRESRTQAWSTVGTINSTTPYTNNFLSLAFEHGTSPTAGSYAYVMLPNRTATSMASYAASPDVTILENTTAAQAVYDAATHTTGANFWTTTQHAIFDQNGHAFLGTAQQTSVTTTQNGNELDIGISDPTQANTGTIVLNIYRPGVSVISKDAAVTVNQLAPYTQITVNVNGAAGKSFSVKLNLAQTTTLGTAADSFVNDGASAGTNYGSSSYVAVGSGGSGYNRKTYLKFNLASISGTIANATVYMVPTAVAASITNQAYLVTDNSWTETGITWNNAPAFGTSLASWSAPSVLGTVVAFDVTAAAQSALSSGGVLSIGISNPGSGSWYTYCSKESTPVSCRPVIVISTVQTAAQTASADAYVNDGASAATNYGGNSYMAVETLGTGYDRKAYLKFDLTGVTRAISQAKVTLTTTGVQPSGNTHQAFAVPDGSWTEGGITWNNAPAFDTTQLASWDVPTTATTTVTFDVTAAAQAAQNAGQTSFSIGVSSALNPSSYTSYYSRNNGTPAYSPTVSLTTK